MPPISEITYSRDATVQAFRCYYQFLVAMYMDESNIAEPPEDGWGTIIRWPNFDKTDKVIDLLRHLPYVSMDIGIAPDCEFVNWHQTPAHHDGEDIKEATEPYPNEATIPPHVVGLTIHTLRGLIFLLDTELGVIYWFECMSEAKNEIEEVEDDPYDWADNGLIPDSEDQVEWRAGSGIWEITDFFEMLKTHLINLTFVPYPPDKMEAAWYGRDAHGRETLEGVQKIFRDHGWPDLRRYRKADCLAAIDAYLQTRHRI